MLRGFVSAASLGEQAYVQLPDVGAAVHAVETGTGREGDC